MTASSPSVSQPPQPGAQALELAVERLPVRRDGVPILRARRALDALAHLGERDRAYGAARALDAVRGASGRREVALGQGFLQCRPVAFVRAAKIEKDVALRRGIAARDLGEGRAVDGNRAIARDGS